MEKDSHEGTAECFFLATLCCGGAMNPVFLATSPMGGGGGDKKGTTMARLAGSGAAGILELVSETALLLQPQGNMLR